MPKRTVISSILIIGTILVAVSAQASQPPTGQRIGAWRVNGFVMEMETGDDDVNATEKIFVTMAQHANCRPDGNCDDLEVSWTSGSSVMVSATFKDCTSEDGDFEQFYIIPVHRWKKAGPAMERQIESDFRAWLGQAALVCDKPERADAFDLKQLRPAFRAFIRILTKFT